jgi:hypothetical protein
MKDPADNFKVLNTLNTLSIDLSCFNSEWNDFSLAVFESILFPKSSAWTATYLKTSFDTTMRRIKNGKPDTA